MILDGPGAALPPCPEAVPEQHAWADPLIFGVRIEAQPNRLFLAGSLEGVFVEAFGLPFLHTGNLFLGVGISATLGLPCRTFWESTRNVKLVSCGTLSGFYTREMWNP